MPPNTNTKKRCIACRVVKSLRAFHKDQRAADGHRSICKDCRAQGRSAAIEPEPEPVISISADVTLYLEGSHPDQLLDVLVDEWRVTMTTLKREWFKHKELLLAAWNDFSTLGLDTV